MSLVYPCIDYPYSPSGMGNFWRVLEPSAAAKPARYTIEQTQPDEFTEYEMYDFPDWDAAGAKPVTAATVAAARRLKQALSRNLPPPDIAAGADGTIGFEWHRPDRTLFIEVGPGATIKGVRISASGAAPEVWPQRDFQEGLYPLLNALFNEPA